MIALTAIIRVKRGHEATVKDALVAVVDHVRAQEPDTIAYFAGEDPNDPCVLTTYERYKDQAALDAHNNSAAVATFFEIAKPLLDGDPIVQVTREIAVK